MGEKTVELLFKNFLSEITCLGNINGGSEKCPCLIFIKYFT